MPDSEFKFLQNPITKQWVVSAPRRAKRPNIEKGVVPLKCPFCEDGETEVFSIPKKKNAGWQVRVIKNKYPFAPVHEVVIHSPDHNKNFDELTLFESEQVIRAYKNRYLEHHEKGQVYIFHNRGKKGGESIEHPHTQIVVIPSDVALQIPRLDPDASYGYSPKPIELFQDCSLENSLNCMEKEEMIETPHFYMFCPQSSQWPDEVWFAPKERMKTFGEISDSEIADFAYTLTRLIQIFSLRHGNDFPFNFYIYPGRDWYLRMIPRIKVLGGFEVGTGVFVNTQDSRETVTFIKDHFQAPNKEKILSERQADYSKSV